MQRDKRIEEIYHRYSPFLRNLCRKKTEGNPTYSDLIEDCIQDTFTIAFQEYEKINAHPNIQAWLIRTCLNRLLPKLKQQRKRFEVVKFSLDDTRYQTEHPQVDVIANHTRIKEAELFQQNLLRELDKQEKIIYYYYFEENFTMRETGTRLGISEGDIKNILKRIRRRAKKVFDECG